MTVDKAGEGASNDSLAQLDNLHSMATLGRLASGLSHELNNPSTALTRAADHLREVLPRWEQLAFELGALQFDERGQAIIDDFKRAFDGPLADTSASSDPLARSEREEEMERLLTSWGVVESWQVASTLVDWGWSASDLQARVRELAPENLSLVARWLGTGCQVYGALQEITASAASISEISTAVRSQIRHDSTAEPQLMRLNDELDRTLTLFRSEMRSLKVERQLDPVAGNVKVPKELNQVWVNLIDNAIDAMGGTGTLTIRTSRRDCWIRIEIADTGSGIPDGIRERLFTPFKTTKAPGQGTGLGLSISREIVQRHGGEIDVSSKPGMTVFSVRIPCSTDEDG